MSKILYLEDEPFLGQVVVDTLQEHDFEVDWVKQGKAAISQGSSNKYDLYLLDVMVPEVDGFTVARELRAIHSSVPIVFMTAKSQSSDVVTGFESGGTEYIKKPFSLDELLARLRNQLRLTVGVSQTEEALEFGSFKLDARRLRLTGPKGEKKLTHRETEILRLLAAHPNQAVERKTLLSQVWGDDSYYNSRNLDVYAKKIRNYLAADNSVELITLKGYGYKLVC